MHFLLDTVTCSAHFKARQDRLVFSRLIQHAGQLSVSRLTCAELYALGYAAHAKTLERIDDFLKDVQILEFDEDCARMYGRIHARLAERGQKAGRAALMIAATAIVYGLVLVTHDRDFETMIQTIPELRLVDWLE